MLESKVEQKFRLRVEKELGAKVLKLVSPGNSGVPDRIVLQAKGKIYFVELKQKGKKPRPLQKHVFRQFEELGFPVYVVDSQEAIAEFIDMVKATA